MTAETQMFGMTSEQWKSAKSGILADCFDAADIVSAAMSLLSDAQEELQMGLTNQSRQTINCAKSLLSTAKDQIKDQIRRV
jgi:hypothetical protein